LAIKLWSVEGKLLKTFKGHSDGVRSLAWSPNGQTIASASGDKTIKLWNLDLENLLVLGCSWLQDYLVNHPNTLEELQVCQKKSMLIAAAQPLVEQGEQLASEGDFEGAVEQLKQAKAWNPELNLNPEVKAKSLVLVYRGKNLANEGDIKNAIAAYTKAQKLDPNLKISADSWKSLCWDGSLHGYAKDVMFACENAVALAPTDGDIWDSRRPARTLIGNTNGDIRDSRGLARALTGNTNGAIEDFQSFINWTEDAEQKAQRQRWIDALRAGENPFTQEELKKLSSQR